MSATELQTPRRGFTVKARARPALASLSAGFTRSDLALAPMPAIGQLAGKGKEPEKKKKMTFGEVMQLASKRAFRGGAAGFIAGVVQVRAFPSSPGARLTTARKTTAVTFSMNDTPSAVDAVDRRARPRRVSVSFAMALATEGHAVCRDATRSAATSRARRRGARSDRADARITQNSKPTGARLAEGRPVNLRAHRWSAPVTNRRFAFFQGRTDFSRNLTLFGAFLSRPRSRSPPAPRSRSARPLRTPNHLFSYHHHRWARSCGSARR